LSKLKVLSGREVCKILMHNGFKKVRQKGSYIFMQKKEKQTTVTIPVPDHDDLKIGTLAGIIRQSGLPRSFFEI